MNTPSHIIDLCGGDEAVMAAVGAGRKRILQARNGDKLPSLWFDAMERLAGRPLPRDVFTFKGQDA